MTFLAAIDWLSISINLLLVVFILVCILMTLLILMQRPKQEGLGAAFGGGVTDQVFGARTTNVLQRGTVYLGSMFFIVSLTLAILISNKNRKAGLLDDAKPQTEETASTTEGAATPAEESPADLPRSLSDELEATAGDGEPTVETTETPAAEPAETPAETPAEEPVETPAEEPAETPAGSGTDQTDQTDQADPNGQPEPEQP